MTILTFVAACTTLLSALLIEFLKCIPKDEQIEVLNADLSPDTKFIRIVMPEVGIDPSILVYFIQLSFTVYMMSIDTQQLAWLLLKESRIFNSF